MAITIIGLGPGDAAHLTRKAWAVLEASDEVYLRTRKHPTVTRSRLCSQKSSQTRSLH